METYCQDYLNTSLSSEFDITFCRAILIKSVFTTRGLLRFTLRALNSISITLVWIAMLLTKHPDIAHIHTSSYTGFYVKGVMVLLAQMMGVKPTLHIHGAEFKEFYYGSNSFMRRLIRYMLAANSAVIVLSEHWRDFFRSIGISDKAIVVMTNSVFVPDIPEYRDTSEKPTILFMSRFEKRKGIYELISVIENQKACLDNCRFVLAGPKTHDWENIAKQIARLNLSRTVEIQGPAIGKDKDSAYRQADIYILQSYAEGMPIGLLEAMSYGLVPITTPVGGIPDVIQDEQNGFLIEPGNSEALAEAINLLIHNKDLRQRLGDAARATIVQKYNWAERAKELTRFYHSLAEADSG
ncbi:MAG: glycosyltransferase family 4 protein [Phycisphaerae bacterium]|nr:glycosyltransferase family 4 protein [Phycisphaerae bacterium]